MKRLLILLSAVALMSIAAAAQKITPYRGVVKNGYNFWLSEPPASDSAKYKPLVIFLHGQSLSGNDLSKVMRYGTLTAVKKGLRLDAYVLAPQSPYGPWKPAKVMADVDWVEQRFPVDTNRVYVLGMSKGGYGAIDLTAAYPSRIAAAMAFCGGATNSSRIDSLNNVPLWIVHGTADRAVSVKESDRVVARMKQADPATPRLVYDRIPGMNHGQPARLFYMPDTYRWLFSHSLEDEERPVADSFTINQATLRNAYNAMRTDRTLIAPVPVRDAVEPAPATAAL